MKGPLGKLRDWWERRKVLRELDQFAHAESETLVFDDNNPVNLAKIALSLNDPGVAKQHWETAMARFPEFAKSHKDALDIMIRLRLFDEAEAIMQEGMRRYPTMRHYAGGYAIVAEERGDKQQALERWGVVMKRHPSWWKAHVHYARALGAIGDNEAADKVLTKAADFFPDEVIVRIEWARNAERRNDVTESLARWRKVWERSKHPASDSGIARALEKLGRLDEAEEWLQGACTRWPLVEEIRIMLAHIAVVKGDTEEALRRWIDVKKRMPLQRFGYEGEIRFLRDLGRYDEAEKVIIQAKDRFPNENWPNLELETLNQVRSQRAV